MAVCGGICLDLKPAITYLGVQIETRAALLTAGDVRSKVLCARVLPSRAVRQLLTPALLQGMYSEGVSASQKVTDAVLRMPCSMGAHSSPAQQDAESGFRYDPMLWGHCGFGAYVS